MAITLEKGSAINLEKTDGTSFKEIYIGLDWGKIQKKGFFSSESIDVDLDASVVTFDSNNKVLETVYFSNLQSRDGAIKHSGDDRGGDDTADDRDNEIINIKLDKLNPNVQTLVFFLNSYKQQSFDEIPYSKISILEGTKYDPKNKYATFNLSSDAKYKGKVGMIMGKMVKKGSSWSFITIGKPSDGKSVSEITTEIQRSL